MYRILLMSIIFSIISNCASAQIDSLTLFTEANGESIELGLSSNGKYWLISSNELFHSKSSKNLQGYGFNGEISDTLINQIFNVLNNQNFKENCSYSRFYKDSIIVCNSTMKITHTAITRLLLHKESFLEKEITLYPKYADKNWENTIKVYNLLLEFVVKIKKQRPKNSTLPDFTIKRDSIKKVSISYYKKPIQNKPTYQKLYQKHTEIEIGEFKELFNLVHRSKNLNPFETENLLRNSKLDEYYVIKIQYVSNRPMYVIIGSKFVRYKNRMWKVKPCILDSLLKIYR